MAKTFGVKRVETDVTDSSGAYTFVELTDLAIPVLAGVSYSLEYLFNVTTAATTTSVQFDLQASPTTAATQCVGIIEIPVTTTDATSAVWQAPFNGYAEAGVSPATLAATAGNLCKMTVLLQPSVAQIVVPRFATEIDTSAVVVKAYTSHVIWREL